MPTRDRTSKASALPDADRVALAEALWQSIDGVPGHPAAESSESAREARLRNDELQSGAATGRSQEQVMSAAKGAIACD